MDVARSQLVYALGGLSSVTIDKKGIDPQGRPYGTLPFPCTVADELLDRIGNREGRQATPSSEADPEIAAMDVIVAALDALDGSDRDVIPRILRWACSRWDVAP